MFDKKLGVQSAQENTSSPSNGIFTCISTINTDTNFVTIFPKITVFSKEKLKAIIIKTIIIIFRK
jgi:hypothetical protein